MTARSTIAPSRSVISYSGGVPHRNGIPVQGREGRAEAWEAKFPERGAYVLRREASQLASLIVGATLVVALIEGMPCQGPGDLYVEPT